MLLLSKDLRVLAASPSYFSAFGTSREAVEGHPVGKTDHGRWNVPAVLTLLEEALAEGTGAGPLILVHEDPVIGARLRLTARLPASDGRAGPIVLLTIEPVSTVERLPIAG